jgi:hypothetical protein
MGRGLKPIVGGILIILMCSSALYQFKNMFVAALPFATAFHHQLVAHAIGMLRRYKPRFNTDVNERLVGKVTVAGIFTDELHLPTTHSIQYRE